MDSRHKEWIDRMKLLQVWLVCSVVFFVAAELYQWIQGVTLPMPIFAIAGTLLAVASNTQIWLQKRSPLQPAPSHPPQSDSPLIEPTVSNWTETEPSPLKAASSSRYYPGAQLPNLEAQSPRSISFTLQKAQPVNEAEDLGES